MSPNKRFAPLENGEESPKNLSLRKGEKSYEKGADSYSNWYAGVVCYKR